MEMCILIPGVYPRQHHQESVEHVSQFVLSLVAFLSSCVLLFIITKEGLCLSIFSCVSTATHMQETHKKEK